MPTKAASKTVCVGTGFMALDIIRNAIADDATIEHRHAGGSCGNVLAVLSYLGITTSAVGRIGDDPAGRELLADLRRWKVDVQFLAAERDRRTPVIIQETFMDGRGQARHRFSRACPICGATMPGYRPLLAAGATRVADLLQAHDFFFFDRVAPGVLELARQSHEQGALVVFEPSGIKNDDLFVECLRVSHVIKYAHERFSDLDPLINRRKGIIVEIRTLGAKGLQFRVQGSKSTEGWQHLPALKAPVVRDTAGSGDWCTAGFLSRVAGVKNPIDNIKSAKRLANHLRFGQALAALNCAYYGARGLMYAVDPMVAVRAAGKLLTHGVPSLPQVSSTPPVRSRSDQACTVCSSGI